LAFPDLTGGANKCSLIEGQLNFIKFGSCEEQFVDKVQVPTDSDRKDIQWRPIDLINDSILRWNRPDDYELWNSAKESELCLYYWQSAYWLRKYRG